MQEKVNESILNDEIKEHLKENRIDHMTYLEGMEVLDSDIDKRVIEAAKAYDSDKYTAKDVRRALLLRIKLRKILEPFYHRQRCRFWKRSHSMHSRRRENILVIPSICLLRSILLIIVKITAFTADLTATIRFVVPN